MIKSYEWCRVNVFLDLLKTENFKHIENLPELDRAIAHLEHLQGIHMDSVKNVAHLQALTNVRIMEFSFDRIIAFLLLIKQALSAKPGNSFKYSWKLIMFII